jgi:hypothetical protein
MKHTLFIILIFLVSCKPNMKQNEGAVKNQEDSAEAKSRGTDSTNKATEFISAARANYLFYHTCANGYADQTSGSEGIAASINVEKLSLQGGNIKSWWMGSYYNITLPDGTIEQDWVQWGYAVDRSGLFPAFYVYSIYPTYRYKAVIILNENQNVPLKYGTRVRFEINRVPGTTLWSFLRDGQKAFDVDLQTTNFDGVLQSCTESWGSNSFSNILHVDYFDMYKNGVWSHVPSASISSLAWKLEGKNQRPAFIISEHEFGGKLASNTIPGLLWQ